MILGDSNQVTSQECVTLIYPPTQDAIMANEGFFWDPQT